MGATARHLDMSNVKEGGNFNQSRIPAGDYAAIITKVEDVTTKSKKESWLFTIKLKNKPSSVFRYQCILEEQMLWKVRNLAIAAGKTVPKKRLKLDPNQLVGKLIGVNIEDAEDYKDKAQSEIAGVFPAAELGDDAALTSDDADLDEDDDDDDDDSDIAGPRFTPSDDEDEEEEEADDEAEDEEEEAEDYSKLTRTELKERIRAIQADFQVRKSHSDSDLADILTDLVADSAPAEDDEEEDEPAPAPAKRTSTAAARKAAKAKVADDDIDELDIDAL